MAFNAYDPNNQQKQDSNLQNNATSVSGTSAAPAAPGAQNSAEPKNTSSGRFTNLQSYLTANPNNNLSQQVGSNLQNQGTELQNQYNQNYNQFQTDVNKGTNTYDQKAVGDYLQNPYTSSQNKDATNQFNQMKSGQYTGPQAFDQNQQLSQGIQNYQQMANQANTENGRYALLSQMYNTPSYNSGQQQLDNLFLQSNPSNLQQGVVNANNLAYNLNNATQNTQAQVQAAQNASAQTGQHVSNDIQGAMNNFQTGINQQVTDANAGAQKNYNTVTDALNQYRVNNAPLDASTLSQLGLNPYQSAYGLNLNNYLNPAAQASAATVASGDQYNNYQALANLAGVSPTLLGTQAQAGTFNPNATFNTDQFNTAVGQRQNELAQAFTPQDKQAQDMLNDRQNLAGIIQSIQGQNIDTVDPLVQKQYIDLSQKLYGGQNIGADEFGQGSLDYANRGVNDAQNEYNNTAAPYLSLMNKYHPDQLLGGPPPNRIITPPRAGDPGQQGTPITPPRFGGIMNRLS